MEPLTIGIIVYAVLSVVTWRRVFYWTSMEDYKNPQKRDVTKPEVGFGFFCATICTALMPLTVIWWACHTVHERRNMRTEDWVRLIGSAPRKERKELKAKSRERKLREREQAIADKERELGVGSGS